MTTTDSPVLGTLDRNSDRTSSTSAWRYGDERQSTAKVSLAERVQVDIAKLRQNDCVLKIPDRRIARPRKRDSASVFECELAGSSFS
jgi:hypothetical protein